MPNYVDLAELKSVLGVGDLYPDAQLEQASTAATNLVLSMLNRYRYAIALSATPPQSTAPSTPSWPS